MDAILKACPDIVLVAEDLGLIRPEVIELEEDYGIPGMDVLLFRMEAKQLKKKAKKNSVLYTGTHDNATCNEDYHTYDSNKRISLRRFFKNQGYSSRAFNEMLCQFALDSNADTVILPIWDICGYKEEARINTPGTVSNKNWTWKLKDFKTFDELWNAFKKQMKHFIDIKIRGNNVIERLYAENMPAPCLSVVTNDCISNAKDYNAGGARYNTNYIQGVGIGTVTDCIAAVKYNVYDKKNFTMEELVEAMDHNFEGYDAIYRMVHDKTPKYGNDDDYADDLMQDVFYLYHDLITGRPTMRGGKYGVDMLPTTCHVYFGDVIGATANGRKAHIPVSEGISPEKSADVNGPTAVIKSCAKMDHLATAGTLLNQKFTPDVVAGEKGLDNMASLIRSYFAMDGHHVQFNVIDRKTLQEAQKHPEDYRDLIVRVAGYSDFFRNLSKPLQDEIINRTEQSFE